MGANLLLEGTAALRRFLEEIFEKVWREESSRYPPYGEIESYKLKVTLQAAPLWSYRVAAPDRQVGFSETINGKTTTSPQDSGLEN